MRGGDCRSCVRQTRSHAANPLTNWMNTTSSPHPQLQRERSLPHDNCQRNTAVVDQRLFDKAQKLEDRLRDGGL